MRTKNLVVLLLLTLSMQMQATEVIYVKANKPVNNGGARSVLSSVQAEIDDNIISIEIKRFVGTAYLYVFNNVGTPVSMQSINVEGSSSSIIDVNELERGEYTLSVVLDETNFSGSFVVN